MSLKVVKITKNALKMYIGQNKLQNNNFILYKSTSLEIHFCQTEHYVRFSQKKLILH